MRMTVFEARKIAEAFLANPSGSCEPRIVMPATAVRLIPSPTARLDAEILLAHLLGVNRASLASHPETKLHDTESAFFSLVARRGTGTPVAYLTGIREFWGLPFTVTESVLIPKPDTETLVERALALIKIREAENNGHPVKVIDVCTGSGCVAVSIKHDAPGTEVTATDISPAALVVARENATRLLAENHGQTGGHIAQTGGHTASDDMKNEPPIHFLQGDLREGIPKAAGGWDFVVSNPPYVPDTVARELLTDGRGEPLLALAGGEDGLDLVRDLALAAREVLAPGGILLVETGEYNAKEAAAFFRQAGYADVVIHRDLEGQDRVVEGRAL